MIFNASFFDALVCCAKAKEFTPSEPLYLLLDGTDSLERHFGNVHLVYRGGYFNVLEMINFSRSMAACDKLLVVDHPEWTKKSRVQRRLALDYSNPATWNAETLKPDNISIKGTWRSGYHKALSMLPIADAEDMEDSNTTLRCPSKPGVVVGVGSVAEIDWSIVGDDVDDEVEQVNDTDVGEVNLAEIIDDPDNTADPYFVIDGKKVYKTPCLKSNIILRAIIKRSS